MLSYRYVEHPLGLILALEVIQPKIWLPSGVTEAIGAEAERRRFESHYAGLRQFALLSGLHPRAQVVITDDTYRAEVDWFGSALDEIRSLPETA